jgi:hypothetical protein
MAKWLIPARRDSLYVIGAGLAIVYTPDLREARRFTVPAYPHYTVLGDGTIAWLPPMFMSDSLVLGFASADGRRGPRLALRAAPDGPDACMPCLHFSMAPASIDDELWLLQSGQYRLQRWTKDGVLRETIRIANSPWRDRWLSEMRAGWGNPNNRAPVLHVRRRPDGLLLVSAQGPTATPWSGPRPRPDPRSLVSQFLAAERDLDQVFEIVDPVRGVLASTRVTHRGFHMIHDGRYVIRLVEASSGIMQIEVWELVLTRD